MGKWKVVEIEDPVTGVKSKEWHLFEQCSECDRDIDTTVEGHYGHAKIPSLVLCGGCYRIILAREYWKYNRVKIKEKWRKK